MPRNWRRLVVGWHSSNAEMKQHSIPSEASAENTRYSRWLWAILLVGVVLRVLWWLTYNHAIENEGAEYARLAENLAAGIGYHGMYGGPHVFFPPLYPILIAALSFVGIDLEIAARLISLAAGIGTIALVGYLAHRLFGEKTGLIATLLTACHPTMIALSVSTYSEGLYLCVALSAVVLTLSSIDKSSWQRAAVAGLVWGSAYLVRPEGLVFGVAFLAMAGLLVVLRSRRLIGGISVVAAGAVAMAIVSLPYIADLSTKAGQFRWRARAA